MKVKELIKKLETLDPEAEVVTHSSNFEMNYAVVDYPGNFTQYDTASKTSKMFRDAFDGNSYEMEVWHTSGGDKKIVILN